LAGTAVTIGNVRGTSLVVLAVGVPSLLAGMRSASHGSLPGFVVRLGAAAYLTYQGVMFCFGTPINSLFLSYVATLGLGFWTLVVLVRRAIELAPHVRGAASVGARLAPALLAVFAGLNALAWLARAAPITWTGEVPDALSGSGLLTSPVWVQDLALWIPAALGSAWLMWQRRALGFLLTAAMLTFYLVVCLSVASDQWWGARADAAHPEIASMPAVVGAFVLGLIVAVPLLLVMVRLGRDSSSASGGACSGCRHVRSLPSGR
jgi:hypothetical protein